MSGNVWEWVQDGYDGNAYRSHGRDDPVHAGGSLRVRRGGGWRLDASYARCANRFNDDPSLRNLRLGFRLLRK